MVKVFPTGSGRPRRRWLRWLSAALGLIVPPLIWIVGYHGYQRYVTAEELQEAVAELDRLDPGWRFDDIEAARRVLPAEENAGPRVRAARKLLPDPWPVKEKQPEGEAWSQPRAQREQTWRDQMLADVPPEVQLDDRQIQELRKLLHEAQAALTEARKLADFPYGRYTVEWKLHFLATLLPHVQEARELVDLLAGDARLHVQEQDVEGACRSAQAAFNAARSLGDEPILISQLVRIAGVTVAILALERIAAQGQPDKSTLRAVQRLLEREEQEIPALLLTSMRGERALLHRMLDAYNTGQLSFQEVFRDRKNTTLAERVEAAWMVPKLRRWHAAYLHDMTEWVEAFRLPAAEQSERLKDLATREYDKQAIWSRNVIPATTRVSATFQRHTAYVRCASAALAVERYRVDHGRWPPFLAQLVPEYLTEVPVDPFDRKPLRLRLLSDGVVVYSVGPDGEDNEGTLNRAKMTEPGTDQGFQLWDVTRRRQPPP